MVVPKGTDFVPELRKLGQCSLKLGHIQGALGVGLAPQIADSPLVVDDGRSTGLKRPGEHPVHCQGAVQTAIRVSQQRDGERHRDGVAVATGLSGGRHGDRRDVRRGPAGGLRSQLARVALTTYSGHSPHQVNDGEPVVGKHLTPAAVRSSRKVQEKIREGDVWDAHHSSPPCCHLSETTRCGVIQRMLTLSTPPGGSPLAADDHAHRSV